MNKSKVVDALNGVKTVDKTPKQIEEILNRTQSKIGSKSIPKMINELNNQGINAGKVSGRYGDNAIEVEGQFFEYGGKNDGWKWRSGAANSNRSTSMKHKEWIKRPDRVDTSKLPSHEEWKAIRAERNKRDQNIDPLENLAWGRGGNSGVSELKSKQWNINYHTEALEKAKKAYEKALADYQYQYKYHSEQLAKAIGEKDKFMVEFRKKFGEALKK